MSNQLQATGAVKVRSLTGVLVGTSGVVSSLNIDGSLGIPQLDVNGKILVSQLPNSVMEYKGTWDASTNTPTLVNGTGNQGDVYLCNVAGTVNFGAGAIAFFVGDQVIYSGSIWQRASGATGTVTSVAVTETGDSLNITGSPITTSGTINIGFNGTNLQYINGAGNLTTFPILTGYVPYTGATTDLNLGANLLKFTTEASDNASIGTTVSGSSSYFDFNLSDDNNQEEWRFRFTPSGGSVYDAVRIRPVSATKSDLLVSGDIGASNFSGASGGTNTGDVTLGTANGLSLASQVLSLAAASASVTGALTSTDWSSFNSKVSSQWTTSGSDIFYNTGNVCVNTTTSGVGRFFVAADNDSGITIRNTGTADRFQLFVGSTGGATYTADNAIIKGTNTAIDFYNGSTATKKVTIPNSGNYLEVYGDAYVQSYVKIGNGSGNYTALTTIASGTKIVTFPNATGTVALTSDIPSLTGYVPYTGATTNLDMGANGLYANNLTIRKISTSATIDFPNTGTMNDPAFIKHTESPDNTAVMSFSVGDNDATNDYFVFGNASSGFVERFKITATGVVTIGTWNGTAIADAYISSAATWNAKQSAITLTTTGSSGAATFVSNTLNIPTYTLSGLGGISGSGNTSYVPKFSSSSAITDSSIYNGASGFVSIGNTNTSSYNLDVTGSGRVTTTLNVGTTAYVNTDLYVGDTTSGGGRFFVTDASNQGIVIRRLGSADRFKMFVGNGTTYTQDNAIILGTNTDIDFYTGSSPVRTMTINNSNKVGIGNPSVIEGVLTIFGTSAQLPSSGTTANSLLQLVGSLGSQLNMGCNTVAGDYGAYIQASDNNLAVPYNLNLQPNGGNVGIGTITPDRLLTIYANTSTTTAIQKVQNAGTGDAVTEYRVTGTSWYVGIDNSDGDSFKIGQDPLGTTDRFVIKDGGNVGIGTSSPTYALQVVGDDRPIIMQAKNVNASLVIAYYNSVSTLRAYLGFGGASSTLFEVSNNENGAISFRANGAERMRISSTGNVGIGTTSPSYLLHIPQGNSLFLGNLFISGTANNPILSSGATGGSMYIQSGGAGEGKIYLQGAAAGGNGYIEMYTQGNLRFTLSSAGNLGLSRSPTSNTLEVNGDASKSTAGSWAANSDINIKTDINTIDGALDRINKVRLVSFKYKDAYKEGNRGIKDKYYHNVIAQEFQEIYPDYVYDSGDVFEEHKVLQVDTNPMYVDSVAAIQELSKMVIELQERIKQLENK